MENRLAAREETTRQNSSQIGFALDLLMRGHGWTGKKLAEAAGIAPTTISAFVNDGLSRERLEELAELMGLSPQEVERAVLAARLVLPPQPSPRTPVDPTPEERRIAEKAAALAACEVADLVLDLRLREIRQENTRRDLEEGRRLAQELKTYTSADQRVLIEGAPDYQHWGLAVALCEDSEKATPRNPDHALALAELALFVAEHVEDSAFKPRLQGWCTGVGANAQRVLGRDLPGAATTFARAWRLWQEGEDSAGLLSKAHLLHLEASLRRAQRLFPKALKLHDDALMLARPEEEGSILLNKAVTLKENGDPEDALQILARAARLIDAERQPRQRCVLRFNQASNLLLLGRAAEAAPIVAEVRELAGRLRNAEDLVRTLWLEGNCAAGLGQSEEALTRLEQVRHEFQVRDNPFDYALASLDVALLHRQEGRFVEVKVLADQMLEVFKAQKVDREAIAAVILFREAAQKEQVTVGLVRRLQDYLSKARSDPQIRFEG